ncbi:histidine kinase, partial [Bacteroidales bacterium OttesenSCG-928-E04]|nr:histidine kinase [Bacteroidales bacterium OttesenSCG-928-E04]
KNALIVILNALLWITVTLVFFKYSLLKPQPADSFFVILTVILLMAAVYLSYFLIYPLFFQKNRISYWGITTTTVIVISLLELSFFEERYNILYDYWNHPLLLSFFHIFIRNMFFILTSLCFSHTKASGVNQKKGISQLEKELAWEKERHEIEKEYMRYKIAPHFLYNIINHIFYCAIEKKEELPELLHKLSCVLDYYMNDSSKPLVELQDEIAFYERYIELERMRYAKGIEVSISVDPGMEALLIAPLLFECYIGNAFKYTPHDGTGKIGISFKKLEHSKLEFVCRNNKQKSTKRHDLISSKNGITFNRKRLEFLYKIAHQLVIEDFDESFSVKLIVKLYPNPAL